MEKTDTEYEIIEKLHDSDNSTIYRAKHNSTGEDVVLKQSKNAIKAGLYNEYNLIKEQTPDSIVRLTQHGKMPALIRNYYPGKSLKEILSVRHGIDFFFEHCFLIIDALKKIHE